ncbi:MAG: DNA N-6-adenine-methyltransferase [Rikenellaceae bacterium]
MDVTFEGDSRKGTNQWLTPRYILEALGHFDLDPCSPINRPWNTANTHYSIIEDGLKQPWYGRCYVNPPYETHLITKFIEKCIEHKNCIALTFARTETKLFQELIFPNAHSILFIKGRLSFYHVTGEKGGPAGAPSCLISFDEQNTEVLKNCGIAGKLLLL